MDSAGAARDALGRITTRRRDDGERHRSLAVISPIYAAGSKRLSKTAQAVRFTT